MICLMFECEERGVLSAGGRPWTDDDIAVAVGGDIAENLKCIRELLEKEVARRNNSGAIYSRRLVRDEQKRRLCSEAGRAGGGNPKLSTFKGDSKGGSKQNSKASSSASFSSSDQNPPKPPPIEKVPEKSRLPWFEDIWSRYPNKDGRKAALKHFMNTVLNVTDYGRIQDALKNYLANEKVKKGFVKNGSTWFNNWEDWVNDPTKAAAKPQLIKCPVPGCQEKPFSTAEYYTHREKCETRFKHENSGPLPQSVRAAIDSITKPFPPRRPDMVAQVGGGPPARNGAAPSAIPAAGVPATRKEEASGVNFKPKQPGGEK